MFVHSSLFVVAPELVVVIKENDHERLGYLCQLYDGLPKFEYKTKTSQNQYIVNPGLWLLSATTPNWIEIAMKQLGVGGGMTSRTIFVYAGQKGAHIPITRMKPFDPQLRAKLVTDLAEIRSLKGNFIVTKDADNLYAKWYEGKPIFDQMPDPDQATAAAMTLSTQAREIIFKLGLEAKYDVDAKRNSPTVERIIETNLLSTGVIGGLGGSKFRIAVAHALLYGLTVMPQAHRHLHGEMVSWGILVQLCLEKNEEELRTLIPFFAQLGIPITLKALGMTNLEDPLFWEGLKRACVKGSSVHFMPFPVDEKKLAAAILEADERAKAWQ